MWRCGDRYNYCLSGAIAVKKKSIIRYQILEMHIPQVAWIDMYLCCGIAAEQYRYI